MSASTGTAAPTWSIAPARSVSSWRPELAERLVQPAVIEIFQHMQAIDASLSANAASDAPREPTEEQAPDAEMSFMSESASSSSRPSSRRRSRSPPRKPLAQKLPSSGSLALADAHKWVSTKRAR